MQCLYCGKHLPLLRKLMGSGEFCSDAHRDKYHEEYNRLAMSRLLQAQSRPEEAKSSTNAAPETQGTTTQGATVAVAEEPEMSEVPGSLIDEFRIQQMRPAIARTPVEIEVAPVFLSAPEPARHFFALAIQPAFPVPRVQGGFLASRAASRGFAAVSAELGPPPLHEVGQVRPLPPETRFAERQPAEAGALPLQRSSTPRSSRIEPLETGVSAIELTQSRPAKPAVSSVAHGLGLPRPGSLTLVLLSTAVADGSTLEIGLIKNFPDLVKLRAAFDLRLKLFDTAENVPEPVDQAAANGRAEVAPKTPRREIEALSQVQADRKQEEPPEPPLNRTLKLIAIPAVAPVAEVLSGGIDSILFASRPRLLGNSTQPLRPKMAVGTAAGPLPPRSGAEIATGHETHSDDGKYAASKILHRSMLHLGDENGEADSDTDAPSLFGKLGGFFGKKSRARKQEVGSRRSE